VNVAMSNVGIPPEKAVLKLDDKNNAMVILLSVFFILFSLN